MEQVKPTDLRINNAVYKKYRKGHFLVKEITATWLRIAEPETGYLYAESYETIVPIELSPTLLEACGFEKDRNGWHLPGTQFSLTEQLYPCWLDRMLWPQDMPEFRSLSLKHLHQLQNLYLALTGSELSINLEKVKV